MSDQCDCLHADTAECTALHLGLDTDQMPDWRARVAESTYGPCDCDCHCAAIGAPLRPTEGG